MRWMGLSVEEQGKWDNNIGASLVFPEPVWPRIITARGARVGKEKEKEAGRVDEKYGDSSFGRMREVKISSRA